MNQNWSVTLYEENARFLSDYGLSLIDWLVPQAGEKILDLGCGDGHLTRFERTGFTVERIEIFPHSTSLSTAMTGSFFATMSPTSGSTR